MANEFNDEMLNALASQLQTVLTTGDVASYLESNINYEADYELEEEEDLMMKNIITNFNFSNTIHDSFIFSRFRRWWKRSRLVKQIRRLLCKIIDELRKLIDEEADRKKIIAYILSALAAAGIVINPVVVTIVVALLAIIILHGFDAICPV